MLPAEAVPTTVVIGADGWAYVGQLMGFPAKPGSAHIWRVNPNAEDVLCSVDDPDPDGNCTVWKSGFTSIFDIAFNPHNRTLYVYEIAEGGFLAFEPGFATGDFPPAVLLEVKGNRIRELVRGQLSQPGGVGIGHDGSIYVTDGAISIFGNNGRLLKVRGS
jgi:sugar lactone lactonase YvrE